MARFESGEARLAALIDADNASAQHSEQLLVEIARADHRCHGPAHARNPDGFCLVSSDGGFTGSVKYLDGVPTSSTSPQEESGASVSNLMDPSHPSRRAFSGQL